MGHTKVIQISFQAGSVEHCKTGFRYLLLQHSVTIVKSVYNILTTPKAKLSILVVIVPL